MGAVGKLCFAHVQALNRQRSLANPHLSIASKAELAHGTLRRRVLAAGAIMVAAATGASAQAQLPPRGALAEVGIDQKLDVALPLELEFRDQLGRKVRLGELLRGRPLILSLAYFRCPMLCPYVLTGLVQSLKALSFEPGREFDVLTVSIDPSDTPALAVRTQKEYLHRYGRPAPADGWRFLTGKEPAIRALTERVGFRYRFDRESNQFAHAAGIMVITPQGRVARYFYGLEYAPRDLRLALVEASKGQIGTPVDQVLLYCFHYDPLTGKYGVVIMNVLRLAGALTVALLAGFMIAMLRRERRQKIAKLRAVSG